MFKKWRNASILLALLISAAVSHAQTVVENAGDEGGFKPYVELPMSSVSATKGLERRVLYFVDFGCPYCRAFHQPIVNWSETLPENFEFEVLPAIGTKEHATAAIAYYAVLSFFPEKLEAFSGELYTMLQDHHRSATRVTTYVSAAKRVGIDGDAFVRATQKPLVQRYVDRAQQLTTAYGLKETPSVVIGNRFLTAPRNTQNQLEHFMMVMNGLISMMYEDMRGSGR